MRQFSHSKSSDTPTNQDPETTTRLNNSRGIPDRDVMCLVYPDGSVTTVKPKDEQL